MTGPELTHAPFYTALVIGLGLCLDAALGDPRLPWHPVRLLGTTAARLEALARGMIAPGRTDRTFSAPSAPEASRARTIRDKRLMLAGLACWLALIALATAVALAFSAFSRYIHPLLGLIADALIVWASIAPRDLASHARRVRLALARDLSAGRDTPTGGRKAVAMLVGRNVDMLDYASVSRACIESVAESSIDGVAAPLFWAALLGPVGAFAYRAVNTMDSLFGHKTVRYYSFGLVAARADDLANFLPARLSSILACLAAPVARASPLGALRSFLRYRLAHESPNAGHPEAAYAGALGLRLGGPARYAEGLVDKPWLNPAGREALPDDIDRALILMMTQTLLSAAVFAGLSILTSSVCY
jgi:adenosylcobinamide-phosphate synthase